MTAGQPDAAAEPVVDARHALLLGETDFIRWLTDTAGDGDLIDALEAARAAPYPAGPVVDSRTGPSCELLAARDRYLASEHPWMPTAPPLPDRCTGVSR